jgi:membrane-associated protein
VLALFDIQSWLDRGGLALAALIIFAETGLLIGFFLPGDSLLFIAGFLASKPKGLPHLPSIGLVVPVLIVAAFVGNQVGYLIGRKFGPSVFDRPDSRLFSQRNVTRTQEFFDHHGTKALVLARFVPIVRTFVPILAGVGKMEQRTFVTANGGGAVVWA